MYGRTIRGDGHDSAQGVHFPDEMTLANAAAGGTAAEFGRMEEAARRMALASTFSASQIANSFYSLASAGLSVTETLQAATGVMLLSQATLSDLGEASDVVSASLSQFSLQATDAYRVSNLFVASTNSSLSTLPKLAFALRQVGPIAAQVGLSIEETVTALLAPLNISHSLNYRRGVPPVVNEEVSTRILTHAIEAIGPDVLADTHQSGGGEDFSWYLEDVPGAMGRLGVWSGQGPQLDLHQPTFDIDERALGVGVRTMVNIVEASA